jgi:hypothetical protein
VFVHSTCRDCGGSLLVTDQDTVHPLCTPKPTRVERLAQEWLEAVERADTAREAELQERITELDRRPPRLLDAALAYAGWGWPVFPLHPAGTVVNGERADKRPATRNGFKDATADSDQILRWWTQNPNYNIGLPTGIAFDVIDIDVPDGPVSLSQILASTIDPNTGLGGLLPDAHGVVSTASGGAHYYIEVRGGGNRASIMPGIDIRGAGGYVVAPPSTSGESGGSWSWTVAPSPTIKRIGATA